jgi:hypothetical protein
MRHVIETKAVGSERADRRRPFAIPLAAAAAAIGVVHANVIAPGIDRLRAAARRIFVLSLGEQAVALASLDREPGPVLS